MSIVIDIGARLKSAFGFASANTSSSLEEKQFTESTGVNDVGVYVSSSSFEEVTLRWTDASSKHELKFGHADLSSDSELQKIFAPPPMVSFSRSKNLVITTIDGSDAEVVERWGEQSWKIKLQGLLIDMANHNYPKSKVEAMRRIFERKAPFAVEADMFYDLGISSIYITDIDIAGVQGFEDTIQYSIEARSIKPVEFFLANTK